jgi:hypothetical protein
LLRRGCPAGEHSTSLLESGAHCTAFVQASAVLRTARDGVAQRTKRGPTHERAHHPWHACLPPHSAQRTAHSALHGRTANPPPSRCLPHERLRLSSSFPPAPPSPRPPVLSSWPAAVPQRRDDLLATDCDFAMVSPTATQTSLQVQPASGAQPLTFSPQVHNFLAHVPAQLCIERMLADALAMMRVRGTRTAR